MPTIARLLLSSLVCLAAWPCLAASPIVVPDGFVLQQLDPTDGSIAKPRDWYYRSSGTKSGWLWTLSEEEPTNGYETGMRIQMLIGVEKYTKKSRETFAANFIDQKRNSSEVLKDCPAMDQGEFMRQCLEVIETLHRPEGDRPYHILYAVGWGKKMDVVVVTIFGTPAENWDNAKAASAAMETFELIGPNFGKGIK